MQFVNSTRDSAEHDSHRVFTAEVLPHGLEWAAAAALAASHADYPSFRSVFPDPSRRCRALPPFLAATVRDAMRFGLVHGVLDESKVLAVALWLPPAHSRGRPGASSRRRHTSSA